MEGDPTGILNVVLACAAAHYEGQNQEKVQLGCGWKWGWESGKGAAQPGFIQGHASMLHGADRWQINNCICAGR